MKKLPLTLLCALAVSPLLVQCASQDEMNQIHYQLRMLNKKVSDLESTTIDNMQKRQAMSLSQIDRLNQDLLELKGNLEETGHLNRRLTEQSKELETAFKSYTREEQEKRLSEISRLETEIDEKDRKLELLSEQIKAQQENLQAIQQARVEDAKRKAAAAAKAAEEARRKAEAANQVSRQSSVTTIKADREKKVFTTGSVASAAPTVQAQPSSTPAAENKVESPAAAPSPPASSSGSLAKGNSLYEQGKFREAYQLFETVANSGEQGMSTTEARYMMGECLFALKEYDQAILEYQNIITNYPSSAKAPAAMFRQAIAFENLNDSDTAKILYKKLIASYKDSPEAAQAQKKLGSL